MKYIPKYKPLFGKDIRKFSSMKARIEKKVLSILENPYHNTEPLQDRGRYCLKGVRSKRIDRNFRIIFAICEECKKLFPNNIEARPCQDCDPNVPENTVVFFTVRPHKIVYQVSKPLD